MLPILFILYLGWVGISQYALYETLCYACYMHNNIIQVKQVCLMLQSWDNMANMHEL